MLVDADAEAQAEFGIVLEQRVAPGRAASFGVLAVGRGGQVAAVDRGAAGGVGHHHAVAEQLAGQADIGRFAAADAGGGKLEQRLHHHRTLDGGGAQLGAVEFRQREEELEILPFLFAQRRLRPHFQRLVAVDLGNRRADVHAQGAAGAVFRRDLVADVHALLEFLALDLDVLEGGRRVLGQIGRKHLGADGGVRADERALAAIDAQLFIPHRDFLRQIALVPHARCRWARCRRWAARSPAAGRRVRP